MRTRLAAARATFASLSSPNYRRFFVGHALSLSGTWMQTVAQSWLVLELTGSGTALGVVVALERLPVLLLAPYGGLVADRVDKRRLLMGVQAAMAVVALTLGVLTVAGVVQFWQVGLLALLLGVGTAFENPARHSFTSDMVGPEKLPNAISLNAVIAAAARVAGPGVAGVLIAGAGTGVCFLVNAATFAAVIYALASMDAGALRPAAREPRGPGQLAEGLRYVRRTPGLAIPLIMMAVVGMLTYEFQVVLPVVAREVFGGDASVYGLMTSAMGVGALVGGLAVAGPARTGLRPLIAHAAVFGAAVLAAAAAPDLRLMVACLVLVGAASVAFLSVANSTLQMAAEPAMRGRVMALFAVAFLGTTPIGGPIAGWLSEHAGGRWAMAVQGLACLVAALFGFLLRRRVPPVAPLPADLPADPPGPPPAAGARTRGAAPVHQSALSPEPADGRP